MRKIFFRNIPGIVLYTAISILGIVSGYSQSAKIKVELKLVKVKAYTEAVRKGLTNNEVRFDVWLEREDGYKSTELLTRMNGVRRSDLPKEVSASGRTIVYMEYGKSVEAWLEGWEEDCGQDSEYTDKFGCKDDRRCMQGFNVDYTNKQPGTWYPMNNLKCANKHEAWVEYRWSFTTLPVPTPLNKSINLCRNETATHFRAIDNYPHSQHIDQYEWNISKKGLVPKDSTEEDCIKAHGANTIKYYECVNGSAPYYVEDYIDVANKATTTNDLQYATDAPTLWVRYREVYRNGQKSPWSERVEKKHEFYKTITPSVLEISNVGEEAVTNLFCGTSPVTLTAKHPDKGGSWNDYYFSWHRKVGGGKFEPIANEESAKLTDNGPADFPGQELQYEVKVYRRECSEPFASLTSNPLFFFEGVPDLSTHIDPVDDVKKASCSGRRDGKIIIRASSSDPNLRYYYNYALLNADGKLESTEIYSSKRWPANKDYPSEDLFPGEYKVQVLHGGYEGKKESEEYTLDKTNGLPSEGYCYSEYTVTVPFLPPLSLNTPSVTPATCYGGEDGKAAIAYSNNEGSLSVKLTKDGSALSSADFTLTTSGTSLTISGLSAGEYSYNIDDSRGCSKDPPGNFIITEPAALSFITTVSDYNESDITCHGADDATITVDATGGNWTNEYAATLTRSGEFVAEVDPFTSTTTFTDLPPGEYSVTVATVGGCTFVKSSAAPISITEPEPLVIFSSETLPITCYGVANGEITVASEGGTGSRQFRVDGGDWQVAVKEEGQDVIVGLDSGWHTVEVKDINGCGAAEPLRFRLTYPTPLAASLEDSILPLCHGGADGQLFITPSGGSPITESYQVRIRAVSGEKEVTQTSAIYSRADPTKFPIKFAGLPSADYEIIVIDPGELRYVCSRVVDTVLLDQPPEIKVETVAVNQPSCAGATDGSVHVKASGGTPGTEPDYYYSVDGTNYVAPNEAGVAVFTGLAAGNHVFYAVDAHHEDYATPAFLDEDSRGKLCTGELNFTLDEPDLISIATTMRPVVCYGTATGSISVDQITGGRGGYTYAWEILDTDIFTPNGYRPFAPTDPLHPTDLAQGSYRLTVRDVAGCQAVVVTEVTQSSEPLVIDVEAYAESCTGTVDGKVQLSAVGGYPPYVYRIDRQAAQSESFFDDLAAGTYLVTVRDLQGCEVQQLVNLAADDITVEVTEQIPAIIGAEDGLIRLRATGGTNRRYYLNGLLSTTGSEFNNLAAGTHTVAIEYNQRCRWEQSFTIDEVAARPLALRVSTEALQSVSCAGAQDGSFLGTISGGAPPYIIRWSDAPDQTTAARTNLPRGTYTLTVTDAAGATVNYPVTVDGPEPLEIINATATRPTCHRGTDGYAEIAVVGGTAPYTYAWSHSPQATTARADQLPAGAYSVTVTDRNGCSQQRTLTVAPTPAPDDPLEPQAITLCTGQSVTVDASLPGAAYAWTSDNGFASGEPSVDISTAGRYFLQVTTDRGCTVYDTLDLITTDNVIDAEFLLPTEILAGDTVVLTEVSWPAPEQTVWHYDESVTTYQSDGEKEYVVFPTPGEYTITLTVIVGNCLDQVKKKIIVSDASTVDPASENGRLGYHAQQEYLLYPNPNDGRFTLRVSLPKAQPIRVSVYDPLFSYRYFQQRFAATKTIEKTMNLAHLKPGVYTLIVETPAEVQIIRFVIR